MDRPGVYVQMLPVYQEWDTDSTEIVVELLRALYGLKQAPLRWQSKFTEYMVSLGYTSLEADPYVFKTPYVGYLVT